MKSYKLIFFSCLILLLCGCQKESEDEGIENQRTSVTVNTMEATDIEYDNAKIHGFLTVKGRTPIKEYGFFYGTTPNPSLRKKVVSFPQATYVTSETYSASIDNLDENTQYYYQAYAVDSNNHVIKGQEESFYTNEKPRVIINSIQIQKIGEDSNNSSIYNIKADATLRHKGYKVSSAGFVFNHTSYGLNESAPEYANLDHKVQCEIINSAISMDIQTNNKNIIWRGTGYFMAYMILTDGRIVISDVIEAQAY